MRIRKEVSPWNIKPFLIMTSALLIIYNVFFLFSGYFNKDDFFTFGNAFWSWLLLAIANPLILSALITSSFRVATLYVNDYQNIPDFKGKLDKHIQSENMKVIHNEPTLTVYTPKHWFYGMFKAWHGSENLAVHWKEEVVITGALRKVSVMEDKFTWNKDFK